MYTEREGIITSLVGAGSHFKGTLVLSGILHVDGYYTGNIESDGQVIIGRSAKVVCDVVAARVVVGGEFLGTITATEKVFILEHAEVNGRIHAPRCVVESGGKINGELSIMSIKHRKTSNYVEFFMKSKDITDASGESTSKI